MGQYENRKQNFNTAIKLLGYVSEVVLSQPWIDIFHRNFVCIYISTSLYEYSHQTRTRKYISDSAFTSFRCDEGSFSRHQFSHGNASTASRLHVCRNSASGRRMFKDVLDGRSASTGCVDLPTV